MCCSRRFWALFFINLGAEAVCSLVPMRLLTGIGRAVFSWLISWKWPQYIWELLLYFHNFFCEKCKKGITSKVSIFVLTSISRFFFQIQDVFSGGSTIQIPPYFWPKYEKRTVLWQYKSLQIILGFHILRSQPQIFSRYCGIRRRRGLFGPTPRQNRSGCPWRPSGRWSQRTCPRHILVSSQWQCHSLSLRGLCGQSLANPGRGCNPNHDWDRGRPYQAPKKGRVGLMAPLGPKYPLVSRIR